MRKKGEKEHPKQVILKKNCKKLITMETFKQFTEKAPNTSDAMKRYKAELGLLISHI